MSDVKLVKTLELKRRGRLPLVVTEDDAFRLLGILRTKESTKKELVAESGLKASIVDKFLKTNPRVIKSGDKKGTKYSAL